MSKKAAQRRKKIIDLFVSVFMLKPVEFNDFFIFSINSRGITFIFAPGRGPGARLERNGRALGARRGRSGRELGARHARQRRCFPFKCNRTNTLTSGPFGHLYWLARSKLRPWPLGTPQSSYPGDCSKAGGNLPRPPASPRPPPASGPCRVFLGRSVSSPWHVFCSTVWVRFALGARPARDRCAPGARPARAPV